MKPDFTEETFKEIKESTKEKATETRSYETGITFKETHTYSKYVQNKHFVYIKDDIVKRLGGIKDALTSNLWGFVENISARYIAELSQNADAKKAELDAIMEAKATAEQIQSIIQRLAEMSKEIETHRLTVKKIKGGINRNV